MKFAVMANPERKNCVNIAQEIVENMDVIIESETAKKLGLPGVHLSDINVDIIITIGGDGTILLALQRAKGAILGINMGVLGFLTEIEPEKIWDAINKVRAGNYMIDRRMKLAVYLNDERLHDCVNEAVIHTSEIAKLRNYMVYFNDELMDSIRADGIIISTPTGSTSYALSAGGPILYPSLKNLVIVPLAPFRAATRAFVMPTGILKVKIPDGKKNLLVLDGQHYVELSPGDEVIIKKSEQSAEFIRFESDFFEKIKRRILVR